MRTLHPERDLRFAPRGSRYRRIAVSHPWKYDGNDDFEQSIVSAIKSGRAVSAGALFEHPYIAETIPGIYSEARVAAGRRVAAMLRSRRNAVSQAASEAGEAEKLAQEQERRRRDAEWLAEAAKRKMAPEIVIDRASHTIRVSCGRPSLQEIKDACDRAWEAPTG